jgi:hypothetical protein
MAMNKKKSRDAILKKKTRLVNHLGINFRNQSQMCARLPGQPDVSRVVCHLDVIESTRLLLSLTDDDPSPQYSDSCLRICYRVLSPTTDICVLVC